MTTLSLSSAGQLLVGDIIRRVAHRVPNKAGFVDDERRAVTYGELEERVAKLAGWLQGQGVLPGDKVAFMMRNSVAFIEVFYGIAMSGGIGVPINFRLSESEVEYVVSNSDSKLLIVDANYLSLVSAMRERLPNVACVVVVGADEKRQDVVNYNAIFKSSATGYQQPHDMRDENACIIMYTSGTTGRPKGAVLTHKNLYLNAMNLLWEIDFGSDLRQIVVPPLFHIAALSTVLINGIVGGLTVIQREFVPDNIFKAIEEQRINTLFLVPAMWNFLLQGDLVNTYDVSSMRKCITGGAVCPLEIKKKIIASFPTAGMFDAFGQTETSPVVTCLHPEDMLRKSTSVGRAVMNVEIRVVDDDMNDVATGEIGEAVYRGPTVMKEYYRNPVATEEAFYGGWFHSGDLVCIDAEGFISIVDRKKDMIISGGENIYSTEVEEVLYLHPRVLEAAVVGIPDDVWGESVKAFIVVKPGTTVTAEEIIAHCTSTLASYKKPKDIEFVDSLPRNAGGKVLKRMLREWGPEKPNTPEVKSN